MTETIQLTRPDDAHLHLRDGAALRTTVPASARVFARAVVMPNLGQPVTTVAEALAYRERILAEVPSGVEFDPRMALYLTDQTSSEEIKRASEAEHVVACKLYPQGATTNSEFGVEDLDAMAPVFDAMQKHHVPLLVHGEATDPAIDVFDREKVFIERSLQPITEQFAALRIVFEHATTRDAIQFVESARAGIAATITPQHLLMNRNDLFAGGLQPHNYCLPVLKRSEHQAALQAAATSGDPRFFLGTDSAPHPRTAKERSCGCAGCFSAPAALALYAQLFDQLGALEKLDNFASRFAAEFYGWPRNGEELALLKKPWTVPARLDFTEGEEIIPYWAGRPLDWQV